MLHSNHLLLAFDVLALYYAASVEKLASVRGLIQGPAIEFDSHDVTLLNHLSHLTVAYIHTQVVLRCTHHLTILELLHLCLLEKAFLAVTVHLMAIPVMAILVVSLMIVGLFEVLS